MKWLKYSSKEVKPSKGDCGKDEFWLPGFIRASTWKAEIRARWGGGGFEGCIMSWGLCLKLPGRNRCSAGHGVFGFFKKQIRKEKVWNDTEVKCTYLSSAPRWKASAAKVAEQGLCLCAELHKYKINIFILRGGKSSLPAKPLKHSLWAKPSWQAELVPREDRAQGGPATGTPPACRTTGLQACTLVYALAAHRTPRDKTLLPKGQLVHSKTLRGKSKQLFLAECYLTALHCPGLGQHGANAPCQGSPGVPVSSQTAAGLGLISDLLWRPLRYFPRL